MKQNDNEKQRYEAPRLTAVSFRTERGFAITDPAASEPLGAFGFGTSEGFEGNYANTGEEMTNGGSLW